MLIVMLMPEAINNKKNHLNVILRLSRKNNFVSVVQRSKNLSNVIKKTIYISPLDFLRYHCAISDYPTLFHITRALCSKFSSVIAWKCLQESYLTRIISKVSALVLRIFN